MKKQSEKIFFGGKYHALAIRKGNSAVITAFVVTSIISTSDLVIISFFGTNNFSTLSLFMFRLMGSYQIEEAQALALLFLIYCFIYFVISYKLLTKLNLRIN